MCNHPNSKDRPEDKSPVGRLRTAATKEDQRGDETPERSLREEAPRSLASSWLAEAQAYLEDHKAGRIGSTRRMAILQGILEPLLTGKGISPQPLAAFTCAPSEDKLARALEVLQRLTALDMANCSLAAAEERRARESAARNESSRYSREKCIKARQEVYRKAGRNAPKIVGESEALLRVWPYVHAAAGCEEPVLILGESGTGKELVAQIIHMASSRSTKALVTLNCASIAHENMGLSEMFGHTKGAFTGASEERAGAFREADCGTLFLDEVGELPREAQAQLLRAVETHEIKPLGADSAATVHVRLICATNKDLAIAVAAKGFRADLLSRIRVLIIHLPPLGKRKEDIPVLVEHFARREDRSAMARPGWVAELKGRPWLENVRGLRNVVKRAIAMRDEAAFSWSTETEADRIRRALKDSNGNQTQAAKSLKMHRTTFRDRLNKYGISNGQ